MPTFFQNLCCIILCWNKNNRLFLCKCPQKKNICVHSFKNFNNSSSCFSWLFLFKNSEQDYANWILQQPVSYNAVNIMVGCTFLLLLFNLVFIANLLATTFIYNKNFKVIVLSGLINLLFVWKKWVRFTRKIKNWFLAVDAWFTMHPLEIISVCLWVKIMLNEISNLIN